MSKAFAKGLSKAQATEEQGLEMGLENKSLAKTMWGRGVSANSRRYLAGN